MLSRRPAGAVGQGSGVSFPCHQNRLVHGVRGRKNNVGIVSLEAIGGAERIDLAFLQCLDRNPSGREALNLDRQTDGLAEEARVIGGETFIVLAADGQVEGGSPALTCRESVAVYSISIVVVIDPVGRPDVRPLSD